MSKENFNSYPELMQSVASNIRIADTYLAKGKLDLASSHYQRTDGFDLTAAEMRPNEHFPKPTPIDREYFSSLVHAWVSTGIIALHNGDQQQAQMRFENALELWDKTIGFFQTVRHPTLDARSYENLAIANLWIGKDIKAARYMRSAYIESIGKKRDFTRFRLLAAAPQPPDGIEMIMSIIDDIKAPAAGSAHLTGSTKLPN